MIVAMAMAMAVRRAAHNCNCDNTIDFTARLRDCYVVPVVRTST